MALRTATDLDFLAANIHGRRSRLAEADRLDELCRLRTVPELARALFPESHFLTAAQLERVLVMDLVGELSEIAWRLGGASGRFLQWLRVRFQVENLKVLARGFSAGMALKDLQPHLVPLPDDLALRTDVFATAGTIEAFTAVCPDDALRAGLEAAIPVYNRQPKPFFVEAGLDCGYLGELLAWVRDLPRGERGAILEIAQQEADTFHLMLVVRGRFHYGLKAEMLRGFHVPGTQLPRSRLGQMLTADGPAGVAALAVSAAIDAVPPGRPGEALDAGLLETLAWNRYYRLANRTFRLSHMGLGAIVAYSAIRRIELANLIRLTEGIRLGLEPKVIRGRLIPRRDLEAARV